jgi:predicted DNA-binding transcriptional regulator AlpA
MKDNCEKLLYSMDELRSVLGIGRTLAYKIAKDRNFPKLKINGRYYFPRDKVAKWIERNQGKECIIR